MLYLINRGLPIRLQVNYINRSLYDKIQAVKTLEIISHEIPTQIVIRVRVSPRASCSRVNAYHSIYALCNIIIICMR